MEKGKKSTDVKKAHNRVPVVYQVKYQQYEVSKYLKFDMPSEEGKHAILIMHTLPQFLGPISEALQVLYNKLPFITLYDNPFVEMSVCVNALQNIARIVWLYSHAVMYSNDIATMAGIVHSALLLEHGLRGTEEGTLNAYMIAFSFLDIDKWVEHYPKLHGRASYESCIELLGVIAEVRRNPNLIDVVAGKLKVPVSKSCSSRLFRSNSDNTLNRKRQGEFTYNREPGVRFVY